MTRTLVLAAAAAALAGCAANNATRLSAVTPAPTAIETGEPAVEYRPVRVAHVRKKTLRTVRTARAPRSGAGNFEGFASYYREGSHVASGGRYHPEGLTAAHRSLPFGTRLRVRDVKTGRSVVVVVNDRGPFVRGRVLDLSFGAAKALGMENRGVNRIHAEVL